MLTDSILIIILITSIYNIIKQNYIAIIIEVWLLVCSVIYAVHTAGSVYF